MSRNSTIIIKEYDSINELGDLVDALTGAHLDATKGVLKCSNCKAFYQQNSFELINDIKN